MQTSGAFPEAVVGLKGRLAVKISNGTFGHATANSLKYAFRNYNRRTSSRFFRRFQTSNRRHALHCAGRRRSSTVIG
jgi:hypothetical protein